MQGASLWLAPVAVPPGVKGGFAPFEIPRSGSKGAFGPLEIPHGRSLSDRPHVAEVEIRR